MRRGLIYARAGRVTEWAEDRGRLHGTVQGSRGAPYVVSLAFDGEELLPDCSCPFDWEPFCKHAVALLAVRNELGPDEGLGWTRVVAGREGKGAAGAGRPRGADRVQSAFTPGKYTLT